jgi:plasmid replication initiation protein
MKNKNIIIQPNHISTARFTYTAIEKNIIYTIVDSLQNKMNKDLNQTFTEQEIYIEMKMIEKNNNYKRIRDAVKSLSSKQIEFEINLPGTNKIHKKLTSILSGLDYEINSKYISFFIPSSAVLFFCYIGGGFTSFQKTIAISLNSIYSKLLYELCCRFQDKGGFNTSIERFKIYLSIEHKYKQIAHLRHKVLNVAEKELKQKADYYFSYSLVKVGRKYTEIKIKIHNNTPNKEEYYGIKEKDYISVYNFLNRYFPNYVDDKALSYSDQLALLGNIDIANERFKRLDDDYTLGKKKKKDIYNLLNFVILPEFGIKTELKNKSHSKNR